MFSFGVPITHSDTRIAKFFSIQFQWTGKHKEGQINLLEHGSNLSLVIRSEFYTLVSIYAFFTHEIVNKLVLFSHVHASFIFTWFLHLYH